MKIKIELENGETIEDSEEFLMKSLKAKAECDHGERYSTPALNSLHETITNEFTAAIQDSLAITEDILRDATGTKHSY